MSLFLRYKINKIFLRNFFRSCIMETMETEEDMLYYSHQKLSNLIQQSGDTNAAIKDYLKNLNYQPVKDFAKGLEWFNVSEPLSFEKHLKGKIVVLDFFTYCCINCMHIIPDLREIEQEFSVEDGLVVIGVHSAKFENEKVSSNILAAVQRYNITHPVVNDHNSQMWKNCDVHCWPTLLLLGPNANPILMLMGEGHKENLQLYIKCALEYYKSKNEISNHKLPFESAFHLLPDLKGPLLFPGKIANTIYNNQEILAISDTGNNRILIIDPNGNILHQIGSGKAGLKDGTFENCQFNAPQGLTFKDNNIIFVADTENHAIRQIELEKGVVKTIVGNGCQGHDKKGGKLWTQQEISSPWDVCIFRTPNMDLSFYPDNNPPLKDVLIIAMAGTHQIWALFFEDTIWWKCTKYNAGSCICIAGSGREENRNNAYPLSSAFAQPSGLAICHKNKEIYIADSESSSVRRLSLVDGKVTPVVGGDRNPQNLFAFGDRDGSLFEAKLQHLLGLAVGPDEKTLYVADTYNHKLKSVIINQNTVKTINPPISDTTDGNYREFNEPGGLCFSRAENKLYIADTNNHAIKILSLNNDNVITSIKKLELKSGKYPTKTEDSNLPVINLNPLGVSPKGGKVILKVNFEFTNGLKLTENAPLSWYVNLPNPTWSCVPNSGNDLNNVDVTISVADNQDHIDFVFKIIACTADTCLPKNFVLRLPISGGRNEDTKIIKKFTVNLTPTDIKIL